MFPHSNETIFRKRRLAIRSAQTLQKNFAALVFGFICFADVTPAILRATPLFVR